MSDNFPNEVYPGDTEGVYEDDSVSDYPGSIYQFDDGPYSELEVIAMAPNGYCVTFRVGDDVQIRIPVRGRLPELIRALQAEYERVTGERI